DTGDTVKLYGPSFKCPCGRKSRVVKEIIGREQDYLILEDGTKVGGSGFFFKKVVHVNRAQIYQNKKGEAIFFLVKGPGYNKEDEKHLIEEIINKLGENFRYEIRYTNDLIRLKNGKTKFVINEIDKAGKLNYSELPHKGIKQEVQEPNANNITTGNIWKEGIQVLSIFAIKYMVLLADYFNHLMSRSS
ncbi:MAG: hypothetical protein ACM34K_02295, partial [Bacillota bacterium]